VNGEKMSKSAGNFYTLRDLLSRGYDPRAIRYLLVSQHYRKPINFTLDGIAWAGTNLNRLGDCTRRLDACAGEGENPGLEEATLRTRQLFYESMDEDLNSAAAIGFIFELVREVNAAADRGEVPQRNAIALRKLFAEVSEVFGLSLGAAPTLDQELEALVSLREELRRKKQFKEADAIRDRMLGLGIVLEDTPDGVRWKKKT